MICRIRTFLPKYGYIMHTCTYSEQLSRVAFINS